MAEPKYMHNANLREIDLDRLDAVIGGLKWQDFPVSNNIEDRRFSTGHLDSQQYWNDMGRTTTIDYENAPEDMPEAGDFMPY